ncbi:MAG TPA: hypothetical protein VHK68_12575, partial [Gemmatimonadales bacterium]|nr:hypothetical protein [Gemmatimonadales bacterium]
MIFEGLVDIDYRILNSAPVLSVLMVDATKDQVKVPPCVAMSEEPHYPAHKAAIFVQGASVSEGGSPINALIPLNDYDVTVTTDRKGFGIVNLLPLVSEDELKQAWGSSNAAIQVDPVYYTAPITVDPNDSLIARIRIDGGDTVDARTNVCEKRQNLPRDRQKHFRFEDDPADHDGRCKKTASGGITAVELGEDVLVRQSNITGVKL